MLPYVTICRTKCLRNLILGAYWLHSKLQTHSIASTKQLYIPWLQKSTRTSKVLQWTSQLLGCCHGGLEFLAKFDPKTKITNMEMFAKYWIMPLSHLFHCLSHQFLHLCRISITFLGNVFTIKPNDHIYNTYKLLLQAKHECKKF